MTRPSSFARRLRRGDGLRRRRDDHERVLVEELEVELIDRLGVVRPATPLGSIRGRRRTDSPPRANNRRFRAGSWEFEQKGAGMTSATLVNRRTLPWAACRI